MLRLLFVVLIILVGIFYSIQGPFYVLLFYLWNAYFRPELWIWSDILYQFRLSLIIGSFLMITSLSKLGRFKLTWVSGFAILFFAQSTVSLIASEHFDFSLEYWLDFLRVFMIAMLITFLVSTARQYRLTLVVIAYSLGLETAKQGWANLVLSPGIANQNEIAFLGDNNGVALGIFMLIPVFVALSQTAKSRWERWIHRFFIVGLIYRAISTYSRGGFLAGGALALITVWRSPRRIRTAIGVAVFAGVVLYAMPAAFWERMDTIGASQEDRDYSSAGRIHFWHVGADMAAAKPLTGVGFNGFRHSYATYDPEQPFGAHQAVHSAWFGALAELGYPGLVFLLGVLAAALVTCWRVGKVGRAIPGSSMGIYARNMQSSFVVYLVGATFLNAQYSEMFWHLVGLTAALDLISRDEAAQADAVALRAQP